MIPRVTISFRLPEMRHSDSQAIEDYVTGLQVADILRNGAYLSIDIGDDSVTTTHGKN